MNEDKWQIQWVREYRQFVIVPPIGAEFDSDDWMDMSFNSIKDAMDWIDDWARKAPGAGPLDISALGAQEPVRTAIHRPPLPAYVPKGERTDDTPVQEPARVYSPGENVQRKLVVNPIADQAMTESQADRLGRYSDMVGLQ